jgi:hypothetical protein
VHKAARNLQRTVREVRGMKNHTLNGRCGGPGVRRVAAQSESRDTNKEI